MSSLFADWIQPDCGVLLYAPGCVVHALLPLALTSGKQGCTCAITNALLLFANRFAPMQAKYMPHDRNPLKHDWTESGW